MPYIHKVCMCYMFFVFYQSNVFNAILYWHIYDKHQQKNHVDNKISHDLVMFVKNGYLWIP